MAALIQQDIHQSYDTYCLNNCLRYNKCLRYLDTVSLDTVSQTRSHSLRRGTQRQHFLFYKECALCRTLKPTDLVKSSVPSGQLSNKHWHTNVCFLSTTVKFFDTPLQPHILNPKAECLGRTAATICKRRQKQDRQHTSWCT